MPYITKKQREKFDTHLEKLTPEDAGELNYVFTRICQWYLKRKGLKYTHLNDITGALMNADKELYRRIASGYEDLKIAENGDVTIANLPGNSL